MLLFQWIINVTDTNVSDILLYRNLYENMSVYDMLYKTSRDPKSLRISFDKVHGFVMVLDGKNKHLVLFDYGLFDKICEKIKYHISKKSGITNRINCNFGRIRIDSWNSLPVKKY